MDYNKNIFFNFKSNNNKNIPNNSEDTSIKNIEEKTKNDNIEKKTEKKNEMITSNKNIIKNFVDNFNINIIDPEIEYIKKKIKLLRDKKKEKLKKIEEKPEAATDQPIKPDVSTKIIVRNSPHNEWNDINHENNNKYLLCIISCEKNRCSKEWIKNNWLNDLIINTNCIDYLFVYGNNNQTKEYELKDDELHLKCDDGYFKLNEKMYYLWNYLAKKHLKKYDFYIKCDDDNYVNNFKFFKLLMNTRHLNSFGSYNNNKTNGIWNKLPTGKWYGPFWEGPIYWFNQEIINFYCANIKQTHLIKNRCEDKLFSDIIRNCTKIKFYKGDICFSLYKFDYKNLKNIGLQGVKNILSYNKNSIVITNLKKENEFKFFANYFNQLQI